jgi:hypothetical protein
LMKTSPDTVGAITAIMAIDNKEMTIIFIKKIRKTC